MVNKYLKAFFLTFFLLLLGLAVTRYIDDSRINSIASMIEESSLDAQSTQHLFLYASLLGSDKEKTCLALGKQIDLQTKKVGNALSNLESARTQNLFVGKDLDLLKRKYWNQNMEFYLYVQKLKADCGKTGAEPILYFFTEKSYNPDEAAQAKILDEVVRECRNVRVFAIPHDVGIPVADVIVSSNSISKYPAIIAGGEKIEGIASKERVLENIQCQAAGA